MHIMSTMAGAEESRGGSMKREAFFAIKLIRILFESGQNLAIGNHAVLLVQFVAITEDRIRYKEPARFWNSELHRVLGFTSPKMLNDARNRAVMAGWLHYDRKDDRSIGEYRTDIPVHLRDRHETEASSSIPPEEQEPEQESGLCSSSGTGSGTGSGKPSKPIPKPIKSGTAKRFIPPTIDEVKQFCLASGLTVNANDFIDHYQSNGWRVGKNPMKDWHATARKWSRSNNNSKTNSASKESAYHGIRTV
jgi:hypothetical protein